jgi:hypothetical protein
MVPIAPLDGVAALCDTGVVDMAITRIAAGAVPHLRCPHPNHNRIDAKRRQGVIPAVFDCLGGSKPVADGPT